MAKRRTLSLFTLLLTVHTVLANVEKVIFLGPSALQIPQSHPTLEDLRLQVLSPHQSTLRTELHAKFPSESSSRGQASWILLDELTEGQRYEVRICWAATQPTSFWLSTYEIPDVFRSPELITSLAECSATHEAATEALEDREPSISNAFKKQDGYGKKSESMLFLQIHAAADYYTSNRTLMENVPNVLVDITLDPFILNVFPRSLLPTAGYLVVLAIGSWFFAKLVVKWLQMVSRTDVEKKSV